MTAVRGTTHLELQLVAARPAWQEVQISRPSISIWAWLSAGLFDPETSSLGRSTTMNGDALNHVLGVLNSVDGTGCVLDSVGVCGCDYVKNSRHGAKNSCHLDDQVAWLPGPPSSEHLLLMKVLRKRPAEVAMQYRKERRWPEPLLAPEDQDRGQKAPPTGQHPPRTRNRFPQPDLLQPPTTKLFQLQTVSQALPWQNTADTAA